MKTNQILARIQFLLFLFIVHGVVNGQTSGITLSGTIVDKKGMEFLPFTNVVLKTEADSTFISGTITDEKGIFSLPNLKPGKYVLQVSLLGYYPYKQAVYLGSASPFLHLPPIQLAENGRDLQEVLIEGRISEVSGQMDKKTYRPQDNLSQQGGSVLQAMQNLPGVTVQDGKIQLRGNDRVVILIDGKQTALTGFGSQSGLDNLAAANIEKIEIIQNPGAKYDANGNAGIINLVFKKEKQEGWSGKAGIALGAGAFWIKKSNYPGIRPQYQLTPKINPVLSLNYRKNKVNAFLQVDNLYTQTLNKNEFTTRTYDDGAVVFQQLKRNRNTNFLNTKLGLDWEMSLHQTLSFSAIFGSEKIIDRGDEPFFRQSIDNRYRLWQFLEDELKTTVMSVAAYQYRFNQPGHLINAGFSYTFHREDEKYFFDNILPSYTGKDAFALISDEHVGDLNLDYVRPLKYGRLETGLKFRYREIPTNMQFFPGIQSAIDSNAGGPATYKETIPAVYGSYFFDTERWEAEMGIRLEYVKVQYLVPPGHPTYKSNGYNYLQPFPNLRIGYKLNDAHKLTLYFGRRVDRPNEVDIRIFPKYDDAELIKVGNPALQPQFTNRLELGYKTTWQTGYFYAAGFHNMAIGTITRIASTSGDNQLIYTVFQNVNQSYNSGIEAIFSQDAGKYYRLNVNLTGYYNQINAFAVTNLYPKPTEVTAGQQELFSWNLKVLQHLKWGQGWEGQLSAVYLAPDLIPQGKIRARFSLDAGIKKTISGGKGELFANATDLLNTLMIKKDIGANGFRYTSTDFYETQVIRMGFNQKF